MPCVCSHVSHVSLIVEISCWTSGCLLKANKPVAGLPVATSDQSIGSGLAVKQNYTQPVQCKRNVRSIYASCTDDMHCSSTWRVTAWVHVHNESADCMEAERRAGVVTAMQSSRVTVGHCTSNPAGIQYSLPHVNSLTARFATQPLRNSHTSAACILLNTNLIPRTVQSTRRCCARRSRSWS